MEFNYVFHFSFSYSLYFSILRDFWKSLQVQITNYTNRASFKIALPLLQRCKSNIIFGFSARKVYVWKFNRRGNIASRLHIPHSILFAVCHRQLLPRTQCNALACPPCSILPGYPPNQLCEKELCTIPCVPETRDFREMQNQSKASF